MENFQKGDILELHLEDNKTAHYLILDDKQDIRYTLLCLDNGGTGNRLKSWIRLFATKVA